MFCSPVGDLDFSRIRFSNPKTLTALKGVNV